MVVFENDYEPLFHGFHDLMKYRVREILLVSSFYDAFVLEEDGGISERIFSEYIDLNLRYIPRVHRVSNAEEALKALKKHHFDLVITMTRISNMNIDEFGREIKKIKPGMPVILLTYEWVDVNLLIKVRDSKSIDKVFYWTGDTRILLAIIKYIEDLKNRDRDIKQGVRLILLIEDSPRFYSLFLPILYTEIMTQTRNLISEGVNDLHRLLRMRARPKIIMAETYEEGKKLYKKYKNSLLGVISDIRFPRKGKIDKHAGFRIAKKLKQDIPDLPFLLQSSNLENKETAFQNGLDFVYKNSPNLLVDIRRFILSNFGFGDFVFRNAEGHEFGRASSLQKFEQLLQYIPGESLDFHAHRNHISIWLRARTEFQCAEKLRPKQVSDFENVEGLRTYILYEIQELIRKNQYGVIGDFGKTRIDSKNSFVKLGSGSLGGKARGLAFLNTLLARVKLNEKFEKVDIRTPHTFVVCSDVFEEFMTANNLQEYAIAESDNKKIARKFLRAKLPQRIVSDLGILLDQITYPIAVRSSSLLEDSQSLPFAGLYYTYMLPNNHKLLKTRLKQLCNATKLVFASVFYLSPKEYVKNTNFRIEEEKMAVIIQQIAGETYNQRNYPVVSGVAQSYNFYPISHMEPEDGVVELALGLGATIADGGQTYRFSPKYPQMNPPYASAADFLKKSQNRFYALNLAHSNFKIFDDEKFNLERLDLNAAEEDGSLFFVAGTFSAQDNAVRDTISIKGPRVVTFANLLKYNLFPLAEILEEILKMGREAFGSHVEIEFAVNLFKDKTRTPEFYLLQIRPMVVGKENVEICMEDIAKEEVVCMSKHAMGNGVFTNLYDLVYIDPELFDASKTRDMAQEVGEINRKLIDEKRRYILLGFGRWGTSDPWLGIPVEWHEMSGAQIIIESNLEGFNIEPSLGSHFFHNLTSLGLGYMHIAKTSEEEFVLWDWIREQETLQKGTYIRHIRVEKPFEVKINARGARGAILKPN
ncbi:MAG: phosphoenolpyruvate synthase [bacterium]|nr:phosphoenolpyruvate synthase [bacterium]